MKRIRKAKESDISELEKLFLVTRQHTFYWENPSKFQLEEYTKATDGETVFVVENQQGNILGFISLCEQEEPLFIHHLFVNPEHQRKGIGAMLIRTLLSWAPLPYQLKCLAKNVKALAFYKKTGWIEIERGIEKDGDYFLLELNSESIDY